MSGFNKRHRCLWVQYSSYLVHVLCLGKLSRTVVRGIESHRCECGWSPCVACWLWNSTGWNWYNASGFKAPWGIQRFKCGGSKSACSRIKSLRQIGTVFSFLFPLFLCPISGSHSGIWVLKHSGLFRKVRNKCYYLWQVYHHGTRGAILSSFVTCLQGL